MSCKYSKKKPPKNQHFFDFLHEKGTSFPCFIPRKEGDEAFGGSSATIPPACPAGCPCRARAQTHITAQLFTFSQGKKKEKKNQRNHTRTMEREYLLLPVCLECPLVLLCTPGRDLGAADKIQFAFRIFILLIKTLIDDWREAAALARKQYPESNSGEAVGESDFISSRWEMELCDADCSIRLSGAVC